MLELNGTQRLANCWRAIKTCALSNVIKINKELHNAIPQSPARLQLAFVVGRFQFSNLFVQPSLHLFKFSLFALNSDLSFVSKSSPL